MFIEDYIKVKSKT